MKRILSLLLVLTLTFGLAACGKSAEEKWQEQYDLGMKYVSEGNYEEAIIAFTVAIEIDPKRAEPYESRGDAYIGSGETTDNLAAALADYQKAVELDETCVAGYLGIADVYIRQGEYDKALEALKAGLEKTGSNQDIADKIAEIESGTILDSSGQIRRESTYDASNSLIYYHEYTYDENGRKSSVTSYDAEGNRTGSLNLTYTEEGDNLDTYWYFEKEGIVYRAHYDYDSSGEEIKYSKYDANGELIRYSLFEHDGQGNICKAEVYGSDGSLNYYITTEFNADNQIVKENQYFADGGFFYYTWDYDENGMVSKYSFYLGPDDLDSYWLYIYNPDGSLEREEEYDGSGNLISTRTYD